VASQSKPQPCHTRLTSPRRDAARDLTTTGIEMTFAPVGTRRASARPAGGGLTRRLPHRQRAGEAIDDHQHTPPERVGYRPRTSGYISYALEGYRSVINLEEIQMKKIVVTSIAACCMALGANPAFAWEGFSIAAESLAWNVDVNTNGNMYDQSSSLLVVQKNYIASQLKVNVDGNNSSHGGMLADGSSFYTYCVELTQTLQSPTDSAMNYQVMPTTLQVTAAKIADLNKLFTVAGSSVVSAGMDKNKAAAFQAAVWEVVYEGLGNSYQLAGPVSGTNNISFTGGNSTELGWAQGLLNSASVYAGPLAYNLEVLHSDSKQDYLNVTAVPEPEAYGLALAGLGVVLVLGRRRHRPSV